MNTYKLNISQANFAAGLLAKAFQDHPLWSYFFPNASERPNKMFLFLGALVRYAIVYGEVHTTSENLEGVAVWLPADKVEISPLQILRSGGLSAMLRMGLGALVRSRRYAKYSSAVHNQHALFPHWYLQLIGVNPEFQGQGFASSLLRPMLFKMDVEQISCFLETQNQENVPIYQHFGFRVVELGRVPGTDIGHWAMLRP